MNNITKFRNYCAGCGKSIPTFAIDRQGTLPTVFCDSVCRTDYENKKKLVNEKTIVDLKKKLTADDIAKRIAKKHWQGYEFNSKPELV